MRINPTIYDGLTIKQRLAAAVEAMARNDDAELERLNSTCPKKIYKQADDAYYGTLRGLVSQIFAHELRLTSLVLSLALTIQHKEPDLTEKIIGQIVDATAGWDAQMKHMGIDPATIDKLVKDLRHDNVAVTLGFLKEQDEIKPDPEKAEETTKSLREFFERYGI